MNIDNQDATKMTGDQRSFLFFLVILIVGIAAVLMVVASYSYNAYVWRMMTADGYSQEMITTTTTMTSTYGPVWVKKAKPETVEKQ